MKKNRHISLIIAIATSSAQLITAGMPKSQNTLAKPGTTYQKLTTYVGNRFTKAPSSKEPQQMETVQAEGFDVANSNAKTINASSALPSNQTMPTISLSQKVYNALPNISGSLRSVGATISGSLQSAKQSIIDFSQDFQNNLTEKTTRNISRERQSYEEPKLYNNFRKATLSKDILYATQDAMNSVYHTPGALAKTMGLGDGDFITNAPTNIATASRALYKAPHQVYQRLFNPKIKISPEPADLEAINPAPLSQAQQPKTQSALFPIRNLQRQPSSDRINIAEFDTAEMESVENNEITRNNSLPKQVTNLLQPRPRTTANAQGVTTTTWDMDEDGYTKEVVQNKEGQTTETVEYPAEWKTRAITNYKRYNVNNSDEEYQPGNVLSSLRTEDMRQTYNIYNNDGQFDAYTIYTKDYDDLMGDASYKKGDIEIQRRGSPIWHAPIQFRNNGSTLYQQAMNTMDNAISTFNNQLILN